MVDGFLNTIAGKGQHQLKSYPDSRNNVACPRLGLNYVSVLNYHIIWIIK